jgi:lysophospholipase L1-like esterase
VELPDGFMVEENFLWDGVHLSPIGHQRCAELIRSQLSLAD